MANKRTIKEIKEAIPDLNSEKVEVISDTLDSILALKKLWKSEGGQELINVLRNNCFVALRKLITAAKNNPTLESLLSPTFEYSSNMDLLSTIQDISTEKELREQLDEAVKEAMGR